MIVGSRRYPWTMLVVACVALLALLLATTACTAPAKESGPVDSVVRLLELRMERSTDASAYAEVLDDPTVAAVLVANAEAEADATTTPTPEWNEPYLAAEEESSARVVVTWIEDAAHAEWPAATVFDVELIDGRWLVTDAETIDAEADVPARLE